jgi:hypothetical protein
MTKTEGFDFPRVHREKFKKMKEYGADACFSKPLPLRQLKKEAARLLGFSIDD